MIATQFGMTKLRGRAPELTADYSIITASVIDSLREDGVSDEEIKSSLQTAFERGVMFADAKRDGVMEEPADNAAATVVVIAPDGTMDVLKKKAEKERERQ